VALQPLRGVVDRPRLRRGLDAAGALIVLQAPWGFGKSALLRQWVRERRTLDGGTVALVPAQPEGDHVRWWSAVLDSVSRAASNATGASSRPRKQDHPRAALERLLLSATEPVMLAVDDADAADPERGGALLDLLEQTDLLRLVLATRAVSPIGDAAHLRLSTLGAAVITGAQLCFTDTEIAELAEMIGLDADGHLVAKVQEATGGWPAVTVGLLTELANSGSWHSAVNRAVAITSEAISSSAGSGELGNLEAMRILSLPDRLTGELAVELTGDEQAAGRLRRLAAAGLLAVDAPTDPVSYRWTGAVRTALQHQLHQFDGGVRAKAIHARLARWFANRNEAAPALQHATEAEQWPLAVQLMEQHARDLIINQPLDRLRASVVQMPLETAATSATVLALRDMWLRVPGPMLLSAARLPTSADELTALGSGDGARRTVEAGLWVISALRIRGWFDEACDYARRLLLVLAAARTARPTDVAEIYPTLQLHAGIALLLGGDFTAALSCLREAYLWAADNPHEYIESDASSKTALAHAAMGDYRRAAAWLDRHERATLGAAYYERYIRTTTATAQLLLAVDQLNPAAAQTAYEDLLTVDAHRELFWGYVTYAQAQYALMTGAAADMLDALRRARSQRRGELGHGAISGPWLAAAEADLLLALGRGNEAEVVVSGEHGNHPMLQVGQARLALLAGDDQAALRLATDSEWDRAALPRSRLEMVTIHAIAAQRTGDRRAAAWALQRAVAAARMTGSLRAFRTVPGDELGELATEQPDAQALLAEPALRDQAEIFAMPVTVVRLTAREKQLLDKLATELTRQQIANSLRVSFNTVKVQLRGLYRKLDVESRADAIARGREYGLLG
jgi:LuxR family maltose regulon positive regulatory protein